MGQAKLRGTFEERKRRAISAKKNSHREYESDHIPLVDAGAMYRLGPEALAARDVELLQSGDPVNMSQCYIARAHMELLLLKDSGAIDGPVSSDFDFSRWVSLCLPEYREVTWNDSIEFTTCFDLLARIITSLGCSFDDSGDQITLAADDKAELRGILNQWESALDGLYESIEADRTGKVAGSVTTL